MSSTYDPAEAAAERQLMERIDTAIEVVAAQLPFPVEVEAEMGGTRALQIIMRDPEADPDDAPDTADIDPDDPDLAWHLSYNGGIGAERAPFTIDSDPEDVAYWITTRARQLNLPAARAATRAPSTGQAPVVDPASPGAEGPAR